MTQMSQTTKPSPRQFNHPLPPHHQHLCEISATNLSHPTPTSSTKSVQSVFKTNNNIQAILIEWLPPLGNETWSGTDKSIIQLHSFL